MPLPSRRSVRACLLLAAAFIAACAPASAMRSAAAPEGRLITRDQIEKSSARTAWEVLQRSTAHLQLSERPGGSVTRRGVGSIYLSDEPLVTVDGVRMMGTSILKELPVAQIASIRVLSAIEASATQGTGSAGGVIAVETVH